MRDALFGWVSGAPIVWISATLFFWTALAAALGTWLRARWRRKGDAEESSREGYVVSAMLGLLALLMGFTFSLAIERFETRRVLVMQDANAIGTAYLRTQLLSEPHRARLSKLLVTYTDNLIALAKLPKAEVGKHLTADDTLLNDIWAATAAAFDSMESLDFSSSYVESINTVIDLDASRRAARQAHVPPEVLIVLTVYLIGTAGVLGYALGFGHTRFAEAFLLLLLSMSLVLIIDLDRATEGSINESQGPMEALSASLHAQAPATFDRWRQHQ